MSEFPLRRFTNVRIAADWAMQGGIALHVWEPPRDGDRSVWPGGAPAPFIRSKLWAHLFDQNEHRLRNLARKLGVRNIVVSRRGERGQHVDLCGRPLKQAMAMASKIAKEEDQGCLFS